MGFKVNEKALSIIIPALGDIPLHAAQESELGEDLLKKL